MKRVWWFGAAWVWMASVVPAAGPPVAVGGGAATQVPAGAGARATLDSYCVTCHNGRTRTADLSLEDLDVDAVGLDADVWERVVRKLRARVMPPVGVPRPDEAAYETLITSLETALDRVVERNPSPAGPIVRRLNRAEYENAIRDLLALEIDAAQLLPPDDSAYGFDTVADVLNVSPALQERYLSAARKISALAVGDSRITPAESTYRVRQDLSQNQHVEGLPLGTIGGAAVRYTFPLDGEYVFQTKLMRTNLGMMRGLEYSHRIEYVVDGERVHSATIGGNADLAAAFETPTVTGDAMEARLRARVRVKAGTRTVGVTFAEDIPGIGTARLQPFLRSSYDTLDWTGRPHIDMFSIAGPFDATGPGETTSRQRIFACQPTSPGDELACARRILGSLARRAYRRPVTDVDLGHILGFYEAGRHDGTFETGIQAALQFILASPHFIFRAERAPAGTRTGSIYRVGDVELASRLSFFLWSTIPDDELLSLAEQGRLGGQVVLTDQVRRMLGHARGEALVRNFAGQWLQLRNLRNFQPNSEVFPDFDDNLRQAFQRETELLFESVIREDRSVLDLVNADYTFVNERLARHYGISNVFGSRFRRVPVPDDARRGVLGHGSVLAVTSYAERTSPVKRGKWVLENLLGTPPPPPLPDVPALEDSSEKARSVRERLEQHRANPVCASCHRVMDPLGFALENFDAIGAWRVEDEGVPIDASGQLADGTHVDGVNAVRQAILSRPDLFVTTLTAKLMTYGLGRGIGPHDMPAVRAIVRQARSQGYRFSSLILGIVNSEPFRMSRAEQQPPAQ